MKEVVGEIAAKEQQLSDGKAQLKTLGGQEAALKGQLADCERRQQVFSRHPCWLVRKLTSRNLRHEGRSGRGLVRSILARLGL